MKIIHAFFIFCLIFATPALASQNYASAIEDLPLMQGMQEKKDSIVIFDTPDGRVITFNARTPAPSPDVLRFYSETLPALGWQEKVPGTFVREGEEINITASAGEAQFSLHPAP